MRQLFLVFVGVVLGLALSRSDIGAQAAEFVQSAIHFLVG